MSKLYINDVFWTFQGEGHHAGRRALFVRMPHCNLRCVWCDTSFDTHKTITVEEFMLIASEEPARFAVVTGGEPMMHKHTPKVYKILKELGFTVAVETNGSFAPCVPFDFVTCSPKEGNDFDINSKLYTHTNEFKYVVDKSFDFNILERHKHDECDVIHSLSPEFGDMKGNLERIFEFIKQYPRWKLSLQTHKWIGIP